MKVTNWISYDEAENMAKSIDTMGGFFKNGMRWKDYAASWTEEAIVYIEALRTEIVTKQFRFTGSAHQYSDQGVPVFEDGTAAVFSYRAWGDLMAAIWSEAENKNYNYMDFYC